MILLICEIWNKIKSNEQNKMKQTRRQREQNSGYQWERWFGGWAKWVKAVNCLGVCVCVCVCARAHTQSCPTLWDPKDCIPPGILSIGILQAGILEWVAIPSSRESSQPRDWTQISRITGGFFTIWATKEAPLNTVFHQLQMETFHFNIFEIRLHFNKQQSM